MNNFQTKKQVVYVKDENGNIIDVQEVATIYDANKLKFLKADIERKKKERKEQEDQQKHEQERLNRSKQYDYYYSKAKLTLVVNYLFTKSQVLGDEFLLDIYELLEKVLNDEVCVETALNSNEELKDAFELVFGKFSLNNEGVSEQ